MSEEMENEQDVYAQQILLLSPYIYKAGRKCWQVEREIEYTW